MFLEKDMRISDGIGPKWSSSDVICIPLSCINAEAPLSARIEPFSSNIMSGFTSKDNFWMISSLDNASDIYSSMYLRARSTEAIIVNRTTMPVITVPTDDSSIFMNNILVSGLLGLELGLIFFLGEKAGLIYFPSLPSGLHSEIITSNKDYERQRQKV
jgi:hypothetical protein